MKISRVTEESEIVFKPRVVTTGTTSTASFTLRNPEVYSETFNHSACIVFDQSMSIFNGQLTIGEFGAFTSFTLTIIQSHKLTNVVLQVSDSGWYKVTASNEYGVNTTSAYLEFTTGMCNTVLEHFQSSICS